MRVYVASKSRHAPMWRDQRANGLDVISSWIDADEAGAIDDWPSFWAHCIDEVIDSDVVLAYHEPGEIWKGALVEIGCKLAHGDPVIVVGNPEGSWTSHPDVTIARSLGEAVGWIGRTREATS